MNKTNRLGKSSKDKRQGRGTRMLHRGGPLITQSMIRLYFLAIRTLEVLRILKRAMVNGCCLINMYVHMNWLHVSMRARVYVFASLEEGSALSYIKA
ncbi:hypothetical protein PoB_004128300 [Plakobranchus ocellatus]|uniref:Histone H2A n=1 Tax=Plakobranchus ocellatus TaxID=259542 RepID=A0AAV4B6N9_9GAST|nr:hypothetical protein PoB_004128300 [Plakobranchus ocellatus]